MSEKLVSKIKSKSSSFGIFGMYSPCLDGEGGEGWKHRGRDGGAGDGKGWRGKGWRWRRVMGALRDGGGGEGWEVGRTIQCGRWVKAARKVKEKYEGKVQERDGGGTRDGNGKVKR